MCLVPCVKVKTFAVSQGLYTYLNLPKAARSNFLLLLLYHIAFPFLSFAISCQSLMKHLFALIAFAIYIPTAQAQTINAIGDTALLYTEYQPIVIMPLANDEIYINPEYSIDVEIMSESMQGLAAFISSEPILGNEWAILYIPYGDFGVSDSFTYRINAYDEFGMLAATSNVATVLIIRSELPSDDCLSDCVYPGDANRDGSVNADDLLYIGIGYGFSGIPRLDTEQGNEWQPHAADDWAADLGGLNFKHFDCNGDGTIDDADIESIILNYGMSHLADLSTLTSVPVDTAPINISLQILNTSAVEEGDTVAADIVLGDATELISVYGLSFSLSFNANDGNTAQIEFMPSFVGIDTNTVNIQKNYGTGRIDAALSRVNHTQAQGSGTIARVSFVMENFLEGKQLSDLLTLSIDRFSLLGGNGLVVNMNIADTTATASIDVILSSNPPPAPHTTAWQLCPNPANNYLHLTNPDKNTLKSVMLYDMQGRLVYRHAHSLPTETIPVDQLPEGIYFAVLNTDKGSTTQRIVVSR